MKRLTRRELLLAMAAALAATPGAVSSLSQTPSGSGKSLETSPPPQKGGVTSAQAAQTSRSDQAFSDFVDRYFDGLFQFMPARATRAGIHKYDSNLPAYARGDFQTEIARSQSALLELSKIPPETLSPPSQFDARLLTSLIRGWLLDLTSVRMWAKDPNFYVDLASKSLYVLIQRDFAPLDDRVKALIARERSVPVILNSARTNITSPPLVYTNFAIQQVQAQIEFLGKTLPQATEGVSSTSLKNEFRGVNQKAIEAYTQFLNYLKAGLSRRSTGQFAIGPETLQKKLLYDEMVDVPLSLLFRTGMSGLRRQQSLFLQTANLIDSSKAPLEVLRGLSQDHPDAGHILQSMQPIIDNQRQFLASHDIVTVPPAPIPQVTAAPPFLWPLRLASASAPGPLEEHSIQAFIYLSLPDPSWSDTQKSQFLRCFNNYGARMIAVREGYPGRYVQCLWLKQTPSSARRLEPFLKTAASSSEGWAQYCEQAMLEQGYGEGDPKLLLFQLRASLIAWCRYLVAIRMHAQGMTVQQAAEFFQSEAYMEPINAQREAARSAFDPSNLAGALGMLEILKLREDYKQKLTGEFNPKAFHDRFLSFGYAPIKMVREQILGDNSPVL
jgi:uncharacterized protein (DUF885 family)